MFGHKHRVTLAFLVLVSGPGVLAVRPARAVTDEPPAVALPPRLSSADQEYLIRLIRQTIEARAAGLDPDRLRNVPPDVRSLQCPTYVTLRQGGRRLGLGRDAAQAGLAEACRQAAVRAVADARKRIRIVRESVHRMAVEVELLGPAVELDVRVSDRRGILHRCKPGLDGLAIALGDQSALLRPSTIISEGLSLLGAVRFLTDELAPDDQTPPPEPDAYRCLRFRTLHFWQPRAKEPVIELRYGCAPVAQAEITRKHLDEAIRKVARHLLARQQSDGLFPAAYLPWEDRFIPSAATIVQAGSAWALASYGRAKGDPDAMRAGCRTIDTLTKRLVPVSSGKENDGNPASPPGAYLRAPSQGERIGATALLLLAAAEAQPKERYAGLRARLTAALRSRQLTTGMLRGNFVTTQPAAAQDTDPGQAVLALTRCYRLDHPPEALRVVEEAFDHYGKMLSVRPSPYAVPWFGTAYADLAAGGRNPRYSDFVFNMLDWLVKHQLTKDDCPDAMLHGGLDVRGRERVGIDTAAQLLALAAACELAKETQDGERASRYRRALLRAVRFVLQLRFRPEEAFYVRSRLNTINGVRTSLWDHTLATENSQWALLGLLAAERILADASGEH